MIVDPGFTTFDMACVFLPDERVALFCRFEAALAQAQAEHGEIPQEAAAAIAEVCSTPVADPASVMAEGWEVGTPVLVLLEQLRSRLSDEYRPHLHRGATTQDVVDSALMLQCKAALSVLDGSLASVAGVLASQADAHRRTPTTGRTFLQAAGPTTFGARFARWLQGVTDARRELARVRDGLPVQLGGPVGDMASLGRDPFAVAEGVARTLELAVPDAPWHTDRWPVNEVAVAAGRAAAASSKIAGDVALLTASGEIRVRAGASSSMPDKRNPVDAMRAEAAAQVCRTAVAGVLTAPSHAFERGIGSWHAEWALVPIALQAGAAAAEAMERCLASLEVTADERLDHGLGAELIDRVLENHRKGLE